MVNLPYDGCLLTYKNPMKTDGVREKLDLIIEGATDFDQSKIPTHLLNDLEQWKSGYYGWTSPASDMNNDIQTTKKILTSFIQTLYHFQFQQISSKYGMTIRKRK